MIELKEPKYKPGDKVVDNQGWGNEMPDRRALCVAERWVLPFVGEKERY